MGPEAFRAFVDAAAATAAQPEDGPGCAVVHATRSWRPFSEPECLLALDSFGQNRCSIQRWTNLRAAAIRDEQVAVAATPYLAPPPPPGPAPAPEQPQPAAFSPPEACGAADPLVFVQFTDVADRPAVDRMRERMLRAGWQVASPENALEAHRRRRPHLPRGPARLRRGACCRGRRAAGGRPPDPGHLARRPLRRPAREPDGALAASGSTDAPQEQVG